MTDPRPADPTAPRRHRGWMVTFHAVDRFCERVARVSHEEAMEWLTAHAHTAIAADRRTMRGDPIYRLAHPWPGTDAALVVRIDPDGTRAVVTCGWWDDDTELDDPAAHAGGTPPGGDPDMAAVPPGPLSPEQIRAGLAERRAAVKPLWFPPPADLPRPPGSLDLGVVQPGLTLDLEALDEATARRWIDHLSAIPRALCGKHHDVGRVASIRQLIRTLRARAHDLHIAGNKARAAKVARTPIQKALDKGEPGRHLALLRAVGEVVRERFGQECSDAIFAEAKRRVAAALPADPSPGSGKVDA